MKRIEWCRRLAPWLLALVPLPAWAGGDDELLNRVSLQAEASEEVANDRMQAVLAVQAEDTEPSRLADRINRAMEWALDRAKRVEGVEVRTESYRTDPVYRNGTFQHWRGMQTLSLESGEFARLAELIGTLQERLQVQSTRFFVSDQRREATEARLIDQGIAAFRERARQVSAGFGASGWRIVSVDVGRAGNGGPPIPMYRMAMAEAAPAPPATAGGTSRISVTVGGTIQLLPAGAP